MTTVPIEKVKANIAEQVRLIHPRLMEISHAIHDNPEVAYEEHKAVALQVAELTKEGFDVECPVAGLDTAFVAKFGQGSPVVAFISEYDAVPNMGHACGHNIMATTAIGAGIALKRALPNTSGTIMVIGTPAEETVGAKLLMLEKGVFRGIDAAITMHCESATYLEKGSLALSRFKIEFFGHSTHAAAFPHKGINALDAMLQLFFSVSAMRQMIKSDARIHGVIRHGGDAPNTIPGYTSAEMQLRTKDMDYLPEMEAKFKNAVDAAALATGCRAELTKITTFKTRVYNPVLTDLHRRNMEAGGIHYDIPAADGVVASTDLGDVSHAIPTIQPYFGVAEKATIGHSPEFAAATASPKADKAIAIGAEMMALVGADVLLQPGVRERVRAAFKEQFGRDPE